MSSASDDIPTLRKFYARAARVLPLANSFRKALASSDAARSVDAAKALLDGTSAWEHDFGPVSQFQKERSEWEIDYAVWKHSQAGSKPYSPQLPPEIPNSYAGLEIVGHIESIRISAKRHIENPQGKPPDITHYVEWIVRELDQILERLTEDEKAKKDGEIERNKLAELLRVKPKTLANRASELPEPVGRDNDGSPIYRYSVVRAALAKLYPSKAFLLPEDFEAYQRTLDTST